MSEPGRMTANREQVSGPWLGFWLPLFVAAALAIIGAYVAARSPQPDAYPCGLTLALAAIAFGFLWMRRRLDGGNTTWADFLLVGEMRNLALAIPVFTIIAFVGLFVAAEWREGVLHVAGIALLVLAVLVILLDIKHVFDRRERLRG